MSTVGIHSTPGRRGYSMQTFTRTMFWPADPRADEVNIVDIGHALSNICRFGGHAKRFYSVAQHSVLVSRIVEPVFALKGLMHDAPEAYIGDLVRPIKRLPGMHVYENVEDAVWSVICERFGISQTLPKEVIEADHTALATEMRDVMGGHVHRCDLPDPLPETINPLPAQAAEELFLARFFELVESKGG